jgi:hypothetical protein
MKYVSKEEFADLLTWEAMRSYSATYSSYVPDKIEMWDNNGKVVIMVAPTKLIEALL